MNYNPDDYPIFLGSEIEQPDPQQAAFHVLPVPYEKPSPMAAAPTKALPQS